MLIFESICAWTGEMNTQPSAGPMAATEPYLAAPEAARQLGVSVPTLYAYVSRGLIRSEAGSRQRRTRRYHAEDIARLKARQEARRDPGGAARKSLAWGMPVLDSAITLITDGRLFYRGRDAVELALTHRLEDVANLIWLGALDGVSSDLFVDADRRQIQSSIAWSHKFAGLGLVDTLQALLPVAAAQDSRAFDLRREVVARTGGRILKLTAQLFVNHGEPAATTIACILQRGWAPQNQAATTILNAALILCADHELNVSSFTARCAASAGATPYDVVLAGLAALKGSKHGGATSRVDAFLREINGKQPRHALADRLKRGELLPGFGQPLYPQGDPRARALLGLVSKSRPSTRVIKLVSSVISEARRLTGEHPNLDFGLTALAWALNLPAGAPVALFALGRMVGWIGHAIEQYEINQLIRPRARYVGPLPE
jgi:citrate synthase